MTKKDVLNIVNLITWIMLFAGLYKLLGTGVLLISLAVFISYHLVKFQEKMEKEEKKSHGSDD